ncbi:MAG: hypothetical protein NWQ28_13495 [Nodularia sp. (in: cyanobacteria)]|nr:hypothetical protein [Nodularia sp. (in: cyanobacteria)]
MKLQKTQKSSKLEQASTLLNQIDDLHQVIGGSVVITCTRDTLVAGQTTTTCTSSDGKWKDSITVYDNHK